MAVADLHRTLDQELCAVMRGASLECLVCGEFVLHRRAIQCPECGATIAEDAADSKLHLDVQAG
jgi:Zn finger protein HypA/HybF involved in hydrogenase expression